MLLAFPGAYNVVARDEQPAWTADLLDAPHEAPDKSVRVRRMFNSIARRYELVNSLTSAGRDRAWRRRAVRLAAVRSDDAVIDVACGTGDFARAFSIAGAGLVVGCDFAREMLTLAVGRSDGTSRWCEGDALRLPFRSGSFSVASCAFGVRNFSDLDRGLAELYRVLRPGGRAVILEFSRPTNRVARWCSELYTRRIMPVVARLISRDREGAYRYLPQSVLSFVGVDELCDRLGRAGFARTTTTPLSLGIVTIHVAQRD